MARNEQTEVGTVVVAIPARDEADRIGQCLAALQSQVGARVDDIVVLVNNSTDATAEVALGCAREGGPSIHVLRRTLPLRHANAGWARRIAMQQAAKLAGPRGVLLTSDADGVVDPDWLAANLACIRAGADAVAGWVDLDPVDWSRIPIALHEDDARECAYDALCDEIHARLDPDPADPMPRHTQHSGASIAVTLQAYRGAGGIPAVTSGEDRAFLAALRRIDAKIRHAPECHVTVSGRIDGRAPGGMADTIRRRLTAPDPFLDDRLEPAEDCARRANLRRRLRMCRDDRAAVAAFARDVGLPVRMIDRLLDRDSFGSAWLAVERRSAVLARRLVPVAGLAAQMTIAEAICRNLRARDANAAAAAVPREAVPA